MSCIANFLIITLLSTSCVIAFGPAPVNLGAASGFTVLAKAGISTVPSSSIVGNIGVSPASGSFLTGFGLARSASGTFSSSPQVVGRLLAADYSNPTPSRLTTAVSDMQTAFTDAAGRVDPDNFNLGSGSIGGLSLTPGLYKWTTGVTIPTALTLVGTVLDTWIFQIAGTLTMAADEKIVFAGTANAGNVVWAVTGGVAIGPGAHFEGIILGATAVTLDTGASMNGRIVAQTAVALQMASIVPPPE